MNYTPKQLQILRLIHKYQNEHGYAPTYAELAKALSVSTITVFEHLEALERKNAIRRRRHEARSVEIIEEAFLREQSAVKSLPVKGTLAAGGLTETGATAAAEELPAGGLFNCKPNSFLLRVKGNAMLGDHILDGDLIVVEGRDTAENGELVVVSDDSGQTALKRFYRENGKTRLQPINPALPPVSVDRCRIHGVFKGLVRRA